MFRMAKIYFRIKSSTFVTLRIHIKPMETQKTSEIDSMGTRIRADVPT